MIRQELAGVMVKRKRDFNATCEILHDYESYLKHKRLWANRKYLLKYRHFRIALTQRQIIVLKLVARGFANSKIAQLLRVNEPAVKLSVHRLIKYFERVLEEKIDRFMFTVIAQQVDFKGELIEANSDIHIQG